MARIILIDDEDAVRRTVRLALERAGHQVLEASDGEAGLKLLAQSGADLVITDIFMPGQDGIVTVRRIRKESPGVKVIAVSDSRPSSLPAPLAHPCASTLKRTCMSRRIRSY